MSAAVPNLVGLAPHRDQEAAAIRRLAQVRPAERRRNRPAVALSAAPRCSACTSDSRPRLMLRRMLADAMISANASAVNGCAWPRPRPHHGRYPGQRGRRPHGRG